MVANNIALPLKKRTRLSRGCRIAPPLRHRTDTIGIDIPDLKTGRELQVLLDECDRLIDGLRRSGELLLLKSFEVHNPIYASAVCLQEVAAEAAHILYDLRGGVPGTFCDS
jgi:hypothetical protein